MADTVLVHPNRDKAEAKATKAAVVFLLVVSAALILIITFGGLSQLQGMLVVAIGWAIVYLVMAWYVRGWNRGVLPVAAGMAVLFTVVAAVAAPAWFARDKAGFEDPALAPSILGLLTLILIPVQVALIAFAMRGFQQQWNVEVEVPREDADRYRRGDTDFEPREPSPA
jgi:presenilin-like A22 family membrane protease